MGCSAGLFAFLPSQFICLSVRLLVLFGWLVGRSAGRLLACFLFGWSASCLVSLFVFVCLPIYLYTSLFRCLPFVSICLLVWLVERSSVLACQCTIFSST